MNVSELIVKLSSLDPDAEVLVVNEEGITSELCNVDRGSWEGDDFNPDPEGDTVALVVW